MESIIDAKNLTKRYGDFTAVDAINFSVGRGEVFGILGPNGAGKTTTLEMLEGLKRISSGIVTLDSHDVSKEARKVKSLIGVQLQASAFFDYLNLKELIDTFASLYGRKVDAMKLLRAVELEEKAKQYVKALSGGQKQRLSIAVALVNDPKVLFLDEPTTGLDPQARRHLWDLIRSISKQGKTIVITTHYMEEAQVLCDRIAIMDHAKIVALDTPQNLLKQSGVDSVVEFSADQPLDHDALQKLPGVDEMLHADGTYRLTTNDAEQTMPALFRLAGSVGRHIADLQLHQATLEDVFLKLTGRSLRD